MNQQKLKQLLETAPKGRSPSEEEILLWIANIRAAITNPLVELLRIKCNEILQSGNVPDTEVIEGITQIMNSSIKYTGDNTNHDHTRITK